MTFNMTKFDKQQIYENNNINTKLLFDNFGFNLKYNKTGKNDNRKFYYSLEPLKILPKTYINFYKSLCKK